MSVATKGKRTTKKSLEEAAQRHREEYTKNFFRLLNEEIFRSGLPEETQLQWNNRLQTTAGKAHFERYAFVCLLLTASRMACLVGPKMERKRQ